MYFNECEYCGATLDPGEKCECTSSVNAYRSKIPNKNRLAIVTTAAKRKNIII